MLPISRAQALKDAGLAWQPALHDFFALPHRGMDEQLFVLSDVMSYVELVQGQWAITFHGAVEWALDYVMLEEILWLPTESQLRDLLEQRLTDESPPALRLTSTLDGYQCEIRLQGEFLPFEAFGASDAYALALLHLLQLP